GRVERTVRPPGDHLAGGAQRVALAVDVPDRDIDPLAVRRGAPFDTTERRTRADRRTPDGIASVRIERPVDAALLPCAQKIALVGASADGEEIGPGAEVVVRTGGRGTETHAEEARDRPRVEPLQALCPLDLPRVEIQREDRVDVVVGGKAGFSRSGVVPSGRDA